MNIFILDYDFEKCVKYTCDKHVISSIKEGAQLLSSACRCSGLEVGYKLTHKNNLLSIWTRSSLSNWLWLKEMVFHLNEEFKYRYSGKDHKSFLVAMSLPKPTIEEKGLMDFIQVMPEQYRCQDVVQAYRNYYICEKKHFVSWKKRDVPEWFK